MAKGNLKADLKMEDIPSDQQVLQKLNARSKPKHLITGNGFSMSYDLLFFHTMPYMIL